MPYCCKFQLVIFLPVYGDQHHGGAKSKPSLKMLKEFQADGRHFFARGGLKSWAMFMEISKQTRKYLVSFDGLFGSSSRVY